MQREEVQQHLDIQAHSHRAQVKGFLAGLIVHYAKIELAVLHPAVHAVYLTAKTQLRTGFRDHHGRHGLAVAKVHLEGDGNKIGMAQLFRHLVYDGVGHIAQAGEEVPEAGIFLLEVVQLLLHVKVNIFAHQGVEVFLLHPGKAAPAQHLRCDVFQQEVQESADLRCVKGRRPTGLCPQAVLHEVGKMAGAQPLRPGGGHGDTLAVKGLDRRPGKRTALEFQGTAHGCKPGRVIFVLGKILPQRTLRSRAGGLQRGQSCC